MVREVITGGRQLLMLKPFMGDSSDSKENSEYVALVDWIRHVPADEAKMKRRAGIYTTTHVRASLDAQPITVDFLSREFQIDFKEILT